MASSLAKQLAQGVSLNASLLVDRSRRQPTQSYLFTPREADQHDLDSIHALGVNGFQRLKSVEPSISIYEDPLFSDAAKTIDRTLRTSEANQELDVAISGLLPLLGPYLLESPAGKVFEWLVRRFRINEFNVETVLAAFLPYQDSPHFKKMLSILHISEQSKFSALLPYKTTSSPLTYTALVDLMIKPNNSDLARFVGSLLPSAVSAGSGALHRTVIAFHAGVLLEFVKRSSQKSNSSASGEGTLAWILPSVLEPLQECSRVDLKHTKQALVVELVLSLYLLLSAISHTCSLSREALATILKTVTSCAWRVSTTQTLRTLGSICAAQASVAEDAVPKSVIKSILKLEGVDKELRDLLKYSGTERLVRPLVRGFLDRLDDERAFVILTTLVTYPDLPQNVLVIMSSGLVRLSLQQEEQERDSTKQARARSLLVHLHQRHPQILQKTIQDVLSDSELDQNAAEQLSLSLSVQLPQPGGKKNVDTGKVDLVMATTSADATVRAAAVRSLYERMASKDHTGFELDAVSSALLARVQDSDASVIEALYSSPGNLLPILRVDGRAYITHVAQILNSQSSSPSRTLLRAHLSFIATHFYPLIAEASGLSELCAFAVQHIFFPQLLFSKARPKTTTFVWETIEATEQETHIRCLSHHELLGGCVEAVRWEEQKFSKNSSDASYEATQSMASINIALAAKLADNISNAPSFELHLKFMLSQIKDGSSHSKGLAYLVCRALLTRLTGERLVEVAHNVLRAMDLSSLEGIDDFLRGADNLQVFLHDLSLATAVVLKPAKRSTLQRLQVALLTAVSSIPRPAALSANWLSLSHTLRSNQDIPLTLAEQYVELMRSLYALANSTPSLPLVSSHIIQALVGGLGDDTLKFLAGIWINTGDSAATNSSRYAALRHATAYLEAHYSTQRFVDFQVVVPALLVAVTDGDRRLREAAVESVTVLVRLAQAKKPAFIYAFDAVYGSSSADLQYLDWPDFCKYVQALHHSRQHLLNDPNYLHTLHQQLLVVLKTDSKKEAAYKQRALCFLLSHGTACPLSQIRLVLLRSTRGIASSLKFRVLSPAIDASMESTTLDLDDEATTLLLASADQAAAAGLNDADSTLWEVYVKAVRRVFTSGVSSVAQATIAHGLRSGLFKKLAIERKGEICKMLLETGHQSPNSGAACKELLTALLDESTEICHLLTALQPSGHGVLHRATKRARVESDVLHEDYASLTLLAEVLGAKPLPGTSELVTTLLDTLNKTIGDSSVTPADKTYVEQLLLSALENVVKNIAVESGKTLQGVRLDTLIELIRVSENPQTSNQALLLVSSLARLVPEAVLQNVMPVFTFMGANVFHRDDSYSFKVVQKTIDSIIPVMTTSLKQHHAGKLDLHIASRVFLRIFTDAYNHIPRHRRISFFVHLVEVLDPADFLSAVCLLLVDKMSNRVVRQSPEEILVSLSLPLSVLERFDVSVRLEAFVEMLQESCRLLESELQEAPDTRTFLEPAPFDDERGSSSQIRRRQAQAVVTFVSLGLRQLSSTPLTGSGAGSGSAILALLLDVAVTTEDQLTQASMDQLSSIARSAINNALRVMSAKDFVMGVLKVVESGKPKLQRGAFDVFSEQLGNVSEKVRQDVRPAILKILEVVKKLLPSAEEQLLLSALNALKALSSTMAAGEESPLTTTVPLVITMVQQRKTLSSALGVLLVLIQKLGPRIIPYFKEVVKECASVLDEEDSRAHAESIGVLHALLTSIPGFWSSRDFLLIIELYLKQQKSDTQRHQTQLSTFVKTLAKRAPSKVLLPTICDLWPRLAANKPDSRQISGYLFVLRRSIHHTDRAVLPEYLRVLFDTFLDMFNLCAKDVDIRLSVETDAIAAFVEIIVKLNEITFKPLFRKLFDWAFTGSDTTNGRKLVLLHVYDALLDYFKSLMTPYMVFLLPPLIELLNSFKEGLTDTALWSAVVQTLTKSCSHDEGAFWREDKLRQLITPVMAQIPISLTSSSPALRDTLRECLVALGEAMNDPSSLKTFNLEVLMHTRSDDARVRIYALSCSEALWQAHGGKLIGFAPETATFIAECAEDDNDSVVREAHRLKNAVESIAGRIDV
ncbi:hypothetical protein BC835DRAFT_1416622 [Cytidiella melzeri]|nr:hypothetical protein BC835DRAFT_1416622 [Cytidiella melzeri]